MTVIGIAMMVFSVVLLIVSIYYIMTTTRHKERMALIARGVDPKDIKDNRFFLEAMKFGLTMIGAGIGFISGVGLESSGAFARDIELPLYFAPVLFFGGIGLVIFYKIFNPDRNN